MYCQLYDLPAEGRTQQKRAVGTTLSNTLTAHRHFVNRTPRFRLGEHVRSRVVCCSVFCSARACTSLPNVSYSSSRSATVLIRFPCVASLNSTSAAPVRPTSIASSLGPLNCRPDYFELTNTGCQGRKMIRLDYLSCFLTILSTVLVGKKLWQGWVVAGANSVIICVIGMRTAEFGFLPGNLFCIGLYANNLWNWRPKAQIANSRRRPQPSA
jgi:hypothetical protein